MKDRRDYRTEWLFRFCSPPWTAMVAGDKLTSAVALLGHIDSQAPEGSGATGAKLNKLRSWGDRVFFSSGLKR